MPLERADGQFEKDYFEVFSDNGIAVAAKYLRDVTGAHYVINPATRKPYVVTAIYDPAATVAYFEKKLRDAQAVNALTHYPYPETTATRTMIYKELYDAFKQGGWGDLQRPLEDKTDVVKELKPAASLNFGIGAAAGAPQDACRRTGFSPFTMVP